MKNSTKVAGGGLSAAALGLLITLVGTWEGRSLQAYRDIVGVPTICYGETRGVEMGDVATPAECNTLLAKGLREFSEGIDACLTRPVPDKVRVAFVSLAYNIGVAGFCGSSVVRRANAGLLPQACDAILMWDKAGRPLKPVRGLTLRRQAERELCLEGLG